MENFHNNEVSQQFNLTEKDRAMVYGDYEAKNYEQHIHNVRVNQEELERKDQARTLAEKIGKNGRSFKYLTKFLVKSGFISIYVYNKKAPNRENVDDYVRKKTVKMSVAECTEFSKDMAYLGKALSKLKKKITIPRDIPLLGVKAGTYDVQRFVYWNFLKCFWDESDNFQRSVGVNFDWYYPKFAYRHTASEVKKWFRDTKLRITTLKEIESGISVTGVKR